MVLKIGVLATGYAFGVLASLMGHYPWRLGLVLGVPVALAVAVFIFAEFQGLELLTVGPLLWGLSDHEGEVAGLVVGVVGFILALVAAMFFNNRGRAGQFCRFGLCSLAIPLIVYLAGG